MAISPISEERLAFMLDSEIPARLGIIDLCRSSIWRMNNPASLAPLDVSLSSDGSRIGNGRASQLAQSAFVDAGSVAIRALSNMMGIGCREDALHFDKRNGLTLDQFGNGFRCARRDDLDGLGIGHDSQVIERAYARTLHFTDKDATHILPDRLTRTLTSEIALTCWTVRMLIGALVLGPAGKLEKAPLIDGVAVPRNGDVH